jgi:uncharacterized membrane protein
MKRITASTWVLVILLVLIAGLGTTLFISAPEYFINRPFLGRFLENEEYRTKMEEYFKEHKEEMEKLPYPFMGFHPGIIHPHFFPRGLVILGIGGLVVALVFALRRRAYNGMRRLTPLEFLEEMYARGEISREEFEKRKKTLKA